jgi:Tol biopolymer transport system component
VYSIMPSRSGLVDIQCHVRVPSHGVLLSLSLLADPKSPASPVGLGYELQPLEERSIVDPLPKRKGGTIINGRAVQYDVATSPATPDGATLGVWSRLNRASFLYDRKTGAISPLPKRPWAEGAGAADVSRQDAASSPTPAPGSAVTTGELTRAGDLFGASVEVVRLGPPVSDARCEDEAFFEPDGRALIFSRSESPGQRELGFFRSERTATGWGNPTPYEVPKGAKSPVFTGDGQSLYFHMLVPDAAGKTSADLFVARRAGGKWGAPENLGAAVNSPQADLELTLSADGGTLVFSSWRPGGQGLCDLYISTRDAKGAWTAARNLGPAINTNGQEGSARLSPDGRTLYFTACGDRPPLEIFTSSFDGTRWSPRRKLSPLVRDTAGDEFSLVPSPGGQEAIFLADKGRMTKDCSDLFLVRPAAMPSRRTWRLEYKNVHGHWTGEIVLERVGDAWTGKMWYDQRRTWEELRGIQVTPEGMKFDRPGASQTYRGRFLPGGKVAGTFTWSGQEWDWAAEETTGR